MPNRLSYSQIEKYKYCSKAWDLHYNKRIRSTNIPSPLIFGSAIGKTFEFVLLCVKADNPITVLEAKQFFDCNWSKQEINNVIVDIKLSKDVVYLKSDHDVELGATPWHSMQSKGHLMIEAFFREFLPLVEKVYSTEEEVLLTSGEDSNIGYADAVLKLKGYDKPIVMDFKTAGRPYEANSVRESVQLSQYLYTLGDKYSTNLAGYLTLSKNIKKNRTKFCKTCGFDGSGTRNKRCHNKVDINNNEYGQYFSGGTERCNGEWTETIHPTCEIQLIIDEIDLDFQEKVVDNIGIVNDSINAGIVVPNYKACDNDFGKPCIYYNLCHNSSMDNLIVLEKK